MSKEKWGFQFKCDSCWRLYTPDKHKRLAIHNEGDAVAWDLCPECFDDYLYNELERWDAQKGGKVSPLPTPLLDRSGPSKPGAGGAPESAVEETRPASMPDTQPQQGTPPPAEPWVGYPNRWGPEFDGSPCGSCGHNTEGDAMNTDACHEAGCDGSFNAWIPPPAEPCPQCGWFGKGVSACAGCDGYDTGCRFYHAPTDCGERVG